MSPSDRIPSRRLEAEYVLGPRHPDRQSIYARQAELSQAAYDSLTCHRDLRYAEHPRATIDVFPAGPGAPMLAFFHGGYWKSNAKTDFAFPATVLTRAGIGFAAIGYPLVADCTLADICAHAVIGIRFLRQNAGRWNGHPDRIAVAGHSAGGHLAAWAATAGESALDGRLTASFMLSGVFDLMPLLECSIGDAVGLTAPTARALSPIHRVAALDRPAHLFVGGAETGEFHRQAQLFADRASDAGKPVTRQTLPGLHHYSIVLALADRDSPVIRAVCAAFDVGHPGV